jgi:predicted nucleic acid-binding protein
MPGIALLDANVLYSAALRDLLLQLSFIGLFQARWSADIDDEWTRNLLSARPDLAKQIALTQSVMLRAIPDALVTGYAARIPELSLPDPGDRHVLAAAITTAADIIVTFNLKDFPPASLAPYGLEAQHPDAFLNSLIATAPAQVLAGVRDCLARLTRPVMTQDRYLAVFERLGLIETAAFLRSDFDRWRP